MNSLNRNQAGTAIIFVLLGIVGMLPVEFVISALLFVLIVRGSLHLIQLATASDSKTKELDKT